MKKSVKYFLILNLLTMIATALIVMISAHYIFYLEFAPQHDIHDLLLSSIGIGSVLFIICAGNVCFLAFSISKKISNLAKEIQLQYESDFDPLVPRNTPSEIQLIINEFNKILEQAKTAYIRNRRFASNAAHELRTPLAAIKTQAQVALQASETDIRENALNNVILSVNRSTHVINQLLTLSKLGPEESLAADFRKVDIHKLATEIIAVLVPLALEKKIEVSLDAPDEAMTVLGNDISLGILIRNLVENAIRYTPEGGEINASIIPGNIVTLRIVDTGVGIAEDQYENVFKRFYRINRDTSEGGSGLGLAIVKQVVDLHKAKIEFSTPKNNIGLQVDVNFSLKE